MLELVHFNLNGSSYAHFWRCDIFNFSSSRFFDACNFYNFAAAASHAFMSKWLADKCNPGGHGPSPRYIGRAVVMNMTSSSWLWRHRLLPLAFTTAYRFSRGPWLSNLLRLQQQNYTGIVIFTFSISSKHFDELSWGFGFYNRPDLELFFAQYFYEAHSAYFNGSSADITFCRFFI